MCLHEQRTPSPHDKDQALNRVGGATSEGRWEKGEMGEGDEMGSQATSTLVFMLPCTSQIKSGITNTMKGD